jgi:hypothetical protein
MSPSAIGYVPAGAEEEDVRIAIVTAVAAEAAE